MTAKKTKIAALSDIHVGKPKGESFEKLFIEISDNADILILGGDLTDHGSVNEAEDLAQQLKSLRIPIIGVLGNHDFTSDNQQAIKDILTTKGNMFVLDEEPTIINGIGFAGVKGFGGGFDKRMLAPFGEKNMRDFVQAAVFEQQLLEKQLELLESEYRTEKKVVILHYSPIRETVIGEYEEIFPFLGSTRLVEPIDNYDVSVVFHGHAHFGSPKGKTLKDIPVYNVAYPIMKKLNPDKPYHIFEL